jgi:hypothetical protein
MILKITVGVVYFTLDHVDSCVDAISEFAPRHDQMWSGMQCETGFL